MCDTSVELHHQPPQIYHHHERCWHTSTQTSWMVLRPESASSQPVHMSPWPGPRKHTVKHTHMEAGRRDQMQGDKWASHCPDKQSWLAWRPHCMLPEANPHTHFSTSSLVMEGLKMEFYKTKDKAMKRSEGTRGERKCYFLKDFHINSALFCVRSSHCSGLLN